jgi:hypothetical protein
MFSRRKLLYLLLSSAAAISCGFTHGVLKTKINLSDYGVSTFSTTGTISAASNSLVVADASGFTNTSSIIIVIGGESGAGARGTVGVGGTWPDLSYATVTAMNADTGQSDGQYAYVVASGNVYQSSSGVWTQDADYYTSIVIPRSLSATITGKSGNTLTLSKSATVTATNAAVYFDNAPIFNPLTLAGSGVANNTELVWPAGSFALSDSCEIQQGHDFLAVSGAGKTNTTLFFPDGIAGIAVLFGNQVTGLRIHSLAVLGNARLTGYMIAWASGNQTYANYPYGIFIQQCFDSLAEDTASTDVFQNNISTCVNSSFFRHDAVLTQSLKVEAWQVQGSDCVGGEITDCSCTSPALASGLEWFRSTGVKITRFTGTNAVMAMNSSDNFVIDGLNLTLTPTAIIDFVGTDNPIVNINTNIGTATPIGGQILNTTINQQAVLGANNDTLIGISVNALNPNITIDGGTITLPNYTAPSTLHGALAVNTTGINTSVKNLMVIGTIKPASGYGNLTFSGSNGCYQNVTVSSIVGGTRC